MGWLTDFFAPKLPPQPDAEPDWCVGDLAECIAPACNWIGWESHAISAGPRKGQISRVIGVTPDDGTLWLSFADWGENALYPAGHFRKLRPASDVEWLQKARKKREPVLV